MQHLLPKNIKKIDKLIFLSIFFTLIIKCLLNLNIGY